MCQRNKDRFTNRMKSWSIYNTMESVFATISMALRGSTMSLSLSFRRTQSGANLEHHDGGRREVWRHRCTRSPTWICAGVYLLGCCAELAGRGRDEEAPVDGRVHFVLDDASLRIHLVFAQREAIDAAYSIQCFGQFHHILDFNRERRRQYITLQYNRI